MRESHADKSISSLMKLTFVLFFFTLVSMVCVFASGAVKDESNLAVDIRNALQYRKNLVAQRRIPQVQQAVQKKIFCSDENGSRSSSQVGYYRVEVERKKAVKKSGRAFYELCIHRDGKELVRLPFLLGGDVQK